MKNLLIYGGYHHDYVYTNHLSEGISYLREVQVFPTFFEINKVKIFQKKNHYFPPFKLIKEYLDEEITKNKITHILNYNTNHFSKSLIESLKEKYKCKISAYYNDSPFSSHLSKKIYYREQKNVFLHYDYIYVYREEDKYKITKEYNFDKSKICIVPPSCPEKKYLKYVFPSRKYKYDFAFIGHYEQDGRKKIIKELLHRGYRCLIVGLKWPEDLVRNSFYKNSKIVNKHLSYKEYLSSLSSAHVNLGFVSSINNDSYTRRYFECPFSDSLFLGYESTLYKKLSCEMPNIFYSKKKLPTIIECLNALDTAKKARHFPNKDQRENFYKINSNQMRASLFKNFLEN